LGRILTNLPSFGRSASLALSLKGTWIIHYNTKAGVRTPDHSLDIPFKGILVGEWDNGWAWPMEQLKKWR
jgi:hypothetical protein